MHLPRIIDKNLKNWAERPNRLPLIMRGARQVGKTAAVMELGRTSGLFDNVVKIDFEEEPSLARVFAGSLKAEQIVRDLEAVTGQPIKAGKTLLFFDEVQECPRAISSLRYFREQMPELHLVAAGSLLEFVLGDLSMPVGRVEYIYVRPMSFGEFLHATGRGLLNSRRPNIMNWTDAISPSAIEAEALDSAFKEYAIVGGMPEAISTYVTTKSLIETARVHDRLIRSFRDDIPKYAQGDLQRANLAQSLLALAVSVGQQITYTKLVDDDAKRTKISVLLLEQAMLVSIARATSAAGLPLGAGVSNKYLKPIYLDVGLMQRACGRSPGQVLDSKNLLADFKGQIAEQLVGQELLVQRSGSENEQLYFWQRAERGSSAEIDFLLSRDGQIIPIEVKSGPSGRLRSLHLFIKSHPNILIGYCLQQRVTLEQIGTIRFAPVWSRLE